MTNMTSFKVLSISYKDALVSIRENFTMDEKSIKIFLRNLNELLGIDEALILATCVRTEIYYKSKVDHTVSLINLLKLNSKVQIKNFENYVRHFSGEQAIRQLYKVALGLDSRILGDIQVSNQVKKAYQYCVEENMAGPFMHRLLHSIFYTNKRVIQETNFKDGAASSAYIVVDLTKKFIKNFKNPRVLILGAGQIAENIAENLQELPCEKFIANRTLNNAEGLAHRLSYTALSLQESINDLSNYDVIISAVSGDRDFIITKEKLSKNQFKSKLVIDMSVPRSIDQEVEKVHNVIYYNIDQIDKQSEHVFVRRKKAVGEVIDIMNDAILEFNQWSSEMEVSPTIKKLKETLESIRKKEIAQYLKNANQKEVELLESVTKGVIQRVLKLPVLQLKNACRRGEAESLVESLHDIFNLEKEKSNT